MPAQQINIYDLFSLNRSLPGEAISVEIAAQDHQLESEGVAETDERRRHLVIAFGILSDDSRRKIYDQALIIGRELSWDDLEWLAEVGELPEKPMPAASTPDYGYPFGYPTAEPQTTAPYVAPFAAAPNMGVIEGVAVDRPTASKRLLLFIGDLFIVGIASSVVFGAFNIDEYSIFGYLFGGIVTVLYFIGFEIGMGGTPAKQLAGYQIRDIATGQKPTIEQAAKRNWWRLVSLLPVFGNVISFVALIILGSSINPGSGYLGAHDRWAGLEVVKKNGR